MAASGTHDRLENSVENDEKLGKKKLGKKKRKRKEKRIRINPVTQWVTSGVVVAVGNWVNKNETSEWKARARGGPTCATTVQRHRRLLIGRPATVATSQRHLHRFPANRGSLAYFARRRPPSFLHPIPPATTDAVGPFRARR